MEKVSHLRIEGKLFSLASAFVALHILDAALSQLSDIRGTLHEANPVMSSLIEQSWGLTWTVKMTIAIGAAFVLVYLARNYPRQINRIFIGLIAIMAFVCMNNGIGLAL